MQRCVSKYHFAGLVDSQVYIHCRESLTNSKQGSNRELKLCLATLNNVVISWSYGTADIYKRTLCSQPALPLLVTVIHYHTTKSLSALTQLSWFLTKLNQLQSRTEAAYMASTCELPLLVPKQINQACLFHFTAHLIKAICETYGSLKYCRYNSSCLDLFLINLKTYHQMHLCFTQHLISTKYQKHTCHCCSMNILYISRVV